MSRKDSRLHYIIQRPGTNVYFQLPTDQGLPLKRHESRHDVQMQLLREIYENPHNNSEDHSFDDSRGASPAVSRMNQRDDLEEEKEMLNKQDFPLTQQQLSILPTIQQMQIQYN